MKPFSELTIALASDHAGFALKNQVRLFLEDNGAKVHDFGCFSDELRRSMDLRDTTIRLSVGLEDVDDILADMKQAFE